MVSDGPRRDRVRRWRRGGGTRQRRASTAARLAACAATRRMPRLISRRLTARLRLARHLTFVVPMCRAATRRCFTGSLLKDCPARPARQKVLSRLLRNGARGNSCSCTKFPRLQCGQITLWMTVIVHRLHNSVVHRTLPDCPVIICIHDVVF